MPITFNAPASGSGYFKPADHDGHLILITKVHRIKDEYSEMAGREIQVAIVDLVDLDFDLQLRENITISHVGIVNGLRENSTYVLGRIGQAPTKKGHPAWVMRAVAADEQAACYAAAQAWVDKQAAGKFQAPAAAPAPAAAAPAVQPTIVADTGALAGFSPEQLAALQNLIK